MKRKEHRLFNNFKCVKRGFILLLVMGFLFSMTHFVFPQKEQKKEDVKLLNTFKKANKSYKEGIQLYLKEKYEKAGKSLEKCIKIFPDHASAHYYLSKIQYKNNNFQEALESITMAKKSYEVFVKMNRTLSIHNMGKLSEEIKDYKGEMEMQVDGGRVRDLRNAIKDAEAQITKERENLKLYSSSANKIMAEYNYVHGNILFKLKQFQEALKEYLQTIKINPKHENAYNNIASIYYMHKDYKKLSDIINQAESNEIKLNPKLKEAAKKVIEKKTD